MNLFRDCNLPTLITKVFDQTIESHNPIGMERIIELAEFEGNEEPLPGGETVRLGECGSLYFIIFRNFVIIKR